MALDPIVVGIQGDDKTGKSTLALTFPKPLRHFDLDVGGFNRAKVRFMEQLGGDGITSKSYYLPMQGVRSAMMGKALSFKAASRVVGCSELWYGLIEDYLAALEDPSVMTVVLDSFPQVWEICRLAYLQEKQEAQLAKDPNIKMLRESLIQIEYSEPNARMRAMIYGARQFGKNLVLTHQLAPVYGKVLKDGKVMDEVVGQKNSGWSHIGKEVDLQVETRVDVRRGAGTDKVSVPMMEIKLSGLGLDVVGMEMEHPDFDKLASMITMMRG